jgi:hypothetical protein
MITKIILTNAGIIAVLTILVSSSAFTQAIAVGTTPKPKNLLIAAHQWALANDLT